MAFSLPKDLLPRLICMQCGDAVGSVPMKWYKDEDHIGYDRDAKKIARKARQDRLDALLARNDSGKAFRTIYDEYNDEDVVLSKEELQMVQRIREGRFPHVEVSRHTIALLT